MGLQQRMNDPGYKNWMKSGQALNLLNESLQPISDDKVTAFHNELKAKNRNLGTCTMSCKEKKEPPDNCKTCSGWKDDIFDKHCNRKMTYWTNVDPKLWPTHKWEVAKTYMPRGQKPAEVYQSDITSVLNLMNTCKIFQPDIEKKRIEKVIQVRNAIMHSTNMKVSEKDLKRYLDTIKKMFEKLVKLNKNAEANMRSVKELENFEFNIYLEGVDSLGAHSQSASSEPVIQLQNIDVQQLETDLLGQRFKALEQRLDSVEDQLSNQDKLNLRKDHEDFLSNNPDLKIKFNDELTEIFETRLSDVEGQVKDLGSRLHNLESKPVKNQGQEILYKNQLQEYCTKSGLSVPVYEQRFHPKGHGCVVTVNGKTFETDPDDPSKKSVESQQKAAKKALQHFGLLSSSTIQTEKNNSSMASTPHQTSEEKVGKENLAVLVAADKSIETPENIQGSFDRKSILKDKTAVQYFKEYCDRYPNYKNVKYTDKEEKGKGFSATVTVEINGKEESFAGEVGESKKSAKQNAAWQVIRRIQLRNAPSSLADVASSSGEVPSKAPPACVVSGVGSTTPSPGTVTSSVGSGSASGAGSGSASGAGSVASGPGTVTSSVGSGSASGAGSVASSAGSVASGAGCVASNEGSVTSSAGSVESGSESVIFGAGSVVSSAGSVVSGAGCVASNEGSVTSSAGSVESGSESVVSGTGAIASSARSVASGAGSDAGAVTSGTGSIASSAGTVASGAGAVTSGTGSIASSAGTVTTGAGSLASTTGSTASASSSVTGPVALSAGSAPSREAMPSNYDTVIRNDVDTIYKNKLQQLVQKQEEKQTPDYSKTVEKNHNGKKCFRGAVEFKYELQIKCDRTCKSKKQAEQQAARQALIMLNSNKKDDANPKGKLLELIPREAVKFEGNGSEGGYTCTLTLNLPLKFETNTLSEGKSKAHQLVAKEALDKINDGTVFNCKYFNFKK